MTQMENDPSSDSSAPPSRVGLSPSSSDREQKKLWFDYIRTLNERRLQSAQRSGFTTYLLLAALAGIAYRFIPRLPSFLRIPGNGGAATAFFLLEIDLLCFGRIAASVLAVYCAQGMEYRIIPEHRRRVTQIGTVILILLNAILALAHVLTIWRFSFTSSPWTQRGLTVLGLYWILNVGALIWKEARKIKKSLAHKIPIPRFHAMQFEPNLLTSSVIFAFTSLLALVSGVSLVLYFRSFLTDWIQPWKAASVSLGFISLSLYMLNRWGLSIGENNYLELERDILLQDLSVEEIRTTFVKQLIGLDASQWLDGSLSELKASNEVLERTYESGRKQLQEIQGIDATYSAERFSRADKLLDELDKQRNKHKLLLGQFKFRLELFFDTYLGPKERRALAQWKLEFSAISDESVRIAKDLSSLISELQALVKNLKETH
jgi:hypothetical protein